MTCDRKLCGLVSATATSIELHTRWCPSELFEGGSTVLVTKQRIQIEHPQRRLLRGLTKVGHQLNLIGKANNDFGPPVVWAFSMLCHACKPCLAGRTV